MAAKNAPSIPPPSPEHRRIATGQFEHANRVVATGNYDYGIRLLLSCCKLDPANLIYRQALRRTERAKYQNNLRGSFFSWLTSRPARARMKTALGSRDYLKALEAGERVLVRNPWDVGAQVDMATAAEALGLIDLAVWSLEQARQTCGAEPTINKHLARLYERRGNFTQAIALWELVRKARPGDAEAQQKVKDLAADETISRGQYEAAVDGGSASKAAADDTSKQASLEGTDTRRAPLAGRKGAKVDAQPKAPAHAPEAAADRLAREAAPIRARIAADPTNINSYLQLTALFRRHGALDEARGLIREGLGPTGNAFELMQELADLELEPFRRDLALADQRLAAHPDDPELRNVRARLVREVLSRELDLHRRKAERYPTELGHRYEMGVRLLQLGQVDEAIHELQAARADPRRRWQALFHLGQCFKARSNWRLAQRNFEEALQALPPGELNWRKDLIYELATGCAEAGDFGHALDLAHELANLDFGYRDINHLLDKWQAQAAR